MKFHGPSSAVISETRHTVCHGIDITLSLYVLQQMAYDLKHSIIQLMHQYIIRRYN